MRLTIRLMLAATCVGLPLMPDATLADPVWDRIESTGTITCGAIPNDKIGSWVDSATGQWEGYEIDLCRAIAADLGKEMGKELKVQFQETGWKTVVLDLQSQKIDIWPGMSATEQRKQALNMIGPMYDLAFCAMDGKTAKVGKTWDELNAPDVRIATVTGTSVEAAFKRMAPKAQHVTLSEYSEITLAVQSGRADIMGADVLRCLNVMQSAPNVFNSVFFPTPIEAMGSSAGVVKSADKLTPWLTDWATTHKADGSIREIFLNVMKKAGYDIGNVPPEVQF
ncbi:transporter substrate-binding domain-containing protein [Paracoccus sp. TOH]|uniref:transporter substrate-binding domain-containing protein n=1 Tax=Paracoccus sp. TOH TaxID=1263728 RepID=UPI0002175480|nr:transporter substrate-binding domain-containing protein [Paracoccus sp. TOH]WJS85362.1 transporter substrate-binding domain-containing protein [Paracoccus sp. TOH]